MVNIFRLIFSFALLLPYVVYAVDCPTALASITSQDTVWQTSATTARQNCLVSTQGDPSGTACAGLNISIQIETTVVGTSTTYKSYVWDYLTNGAARFVKAPLYTSSCLQTACVAPSSLITTQLDSGTSSSCSVPSCNSGSSGGYVERSYNPVVGLSSPTFECVRGCITKTSFTFAARYTDGAGVFQSKQVGETFQTGSACNTVTSDGSSVTKPAPLNSSTNPNSAQTATCPPGQTLQTINGLSSCAPATSGQEASTIKSSTTTDSSGNQTTTSSTTTCSSGQCTTKITTTITPPTGAPTTTTKTDVTDKTSFCIANPDLSICKLTSFSGSCGSAPACTGDAVQCATAAAVFQTNCTISTKPSLTEIDVYDAAKTNPGGDQTKDLAGNSLVTFGASNFDQTELLGSASGVSDLTISVVGQSLTLKFSSLNVWLARLGFLLQAITLLLCARIVVRG